MFSLLACEIKQCLKIIFVASHGDRLALYYRVILHSYFISWRWLYRERVHSIALEVVLLNVHSVVLEVVTAVEDCTCERLCWIIALNPPASCGITMNSFSKQILHNRANILTQLLIASRIVSEPHINVCYF